MVGAGVGIWGAWLVSCQHIVGPGSWLVMCREESLACMLLAEGPGLGLSLVCSQGNH